VRRLSGTSYIQSLEIPALDGCALCATIIEAGMTGGINAARHYSRYFGCGTMRM